MTTYEVINSVYLKRPLILIEAGQSTIILQVVLLYYKHFFHRIQDVRQSCSLLLVL
jgi:hypothetical protein